MSEKLIELCEVERLSGGDHGDATPGRLLADIIGWLWFMVLSKVFQSSAPDKKGSQG